MSALGTFIGVTVFYCALPFVRVSHQFCGKSNFYFFLKFRQKFETLASLPVSTVHLEGIEEKPRVSHVYLGVFRPKVSS